MHPSDIVASLRKRGSSVSQIARDIGVRQASASAIVNGVSRSQRIEERIGEVTQIPLYELWPKWHKAPKGEADRPAIGSAGVDPVVLGFVLHAIEDELVQRVPSLAKPYELQMLHVGRVYNNLAVRTQDHPQFTTVLKDAARAYVATFDYEGGPDLLGVFLRKGVTQKRPTGDDRSINIAGNVGRQVNLTGDGQTFVMGKHLKTKPK